MRYISKNRYVKAMRMNLPFSITRPSTRDTEEYIENGAVGDWIVEDINGLQVIMDDANFRNSYELVIG